jgi:hypothetical protein
MRQPRLWVRYAVAPALLGAASLCAGLSAQAQSTTPVTPAATQPAQAPGATAPRAGEDDAAEFAKLDKNHDGFVDKTEAILEPRLLAEWTKVDTNKDGKVSKDEFLTFERARHTKK